LIELNWLTFFKIKTTKKLNLIKNSWLILKMFWIFWKFKKIEKNFEKIFRSGGHACGEYKKCALPSQFHFLIVRQFTLFTQFTIFWKLPQLNRHNQNNSEFSEMYIFLWNIQLSEYSNNYHLLFCCIIATRFYSSLYIYYTIYLVVFQSVVFYKFT
jgi:hypothetical protein